METHGCSWLITTIKEIIKINKEKKLPQSFKFSNSREAAKDNAKLLKSCRYDFEKAIKKGKGTMLEIGSEFRSAKKLKKLFNKHETWPKMEKMLTEGVAYKLEDLPETVSKKDLDHTIKTGNHN